MSSELAISSKVEQVLIQGNLATLSPEERVNYYKAVCDSVGLNPLTRPFEYLTLNGKLVLYAKRDATDQLRKIHGVSVRITARETIEGVYVVTAQATDKSGRVDESTGAVTVASLKGDALANAFMKAETKSKRRVTLSICGLGLLDETEIETIPGARVHEDPPPKNGNGHRATPKDNLHERQQAIGALRQIPFMESESEQRMEFRDITKQVAEAADAGRLSPADVAAIRAVAEEINRECFEEKPAPQPATVPPSGGSEDDIPF